ncbi:hypothetical protein Q7P37_004737 [Cladosporium fusiforme]
MSGSYNPGGPYNWQYPPALPGRSAVPSPSSEHSSTGPPRFQSLARIANQGVAGRSEEQRGGSMERRQSAWKRRWSGDKLRYEDNLGCEEHELHAPFFTPSYLRGNRFMERLRRGWDLHIAELEEKRDARDGQSRSRKASGSFRGVVQDVVERSNPAGLLSGAHSPEDEDNEASTGLPGRWSDYDKWPGLEVVGDGTEVRFSGVCKTTDEAASIRTDYPIPMEFGLYYYEVTILSKCKEGLIGLGFSGKKTALNRLPGWENESWAYHGDDGYSFAQSANGKAYGPKFHNLDVIGCGVNFRTGHAFFTRNGIHLGTAFTGLKVAEALYPSIGIKKSGEHIRANFGRDKFVFDIDGMMAQERRFIRNELNQADVSSLHPPDNENTLIQKLISQYLAHEGYVETSKAFAADVRDRAASLNTPGADAAAAASLANKEDDVQTLNRQKIRKAILDGDIDKALKYTHSFYPLVLQDERNKDIYFQLRCRKFVEMMRRYSELQTGLAESGGGGGGSNGHAEEEEPLDNQMELDDQLNREYSKQQQPQQSQTENNLNEDDEDNEKMDTSTSSLSLAPNKPVLLKANDHLSAALQYGQELQAEFGSDPRPAVKEQLREVFAIMAYVDPRESVVGGLLDTKGRVGIAEGVNGAVLVSLGKPSSAALEKVCAQTEAFLDAVAGKSGGGKAGFVNVREDFLRSGRAGGSGSGGLVG